MSDEQRITLTPVSTISPMLTNKKGVSRACSVSERTVSNWQSKGIIPFLKISDRFVLFDLAEVCAALKQRYGVQAKANSKPGVGR